MKRRILILITLLLAASTYVQQDASAQQREASAEMESRVFEIEHQDARAIADTIRLLGTRGHGSDLSVNHELNTVTVRDFPEKIATMEAAIGRLDVASAKTRAIRLHLYVLVGSNGSDPDPELPAEMSNVVRELKSALRYSSYALMTAALHQTRAGHGVEGSGVADAAMVGIKTPGDAPLIYSYSLGGIEVLTPGDDVAVDVRNFRFTMKVPITQGESLDYVNVGFDTPVMIREGERVVVGTTAMGNKALVVVVTAKVEEN